VSITARDYSYDAPETVSTGVISFTMTNRGGEEHQAQFLRLNDGVTLEQFGAAVQQGGPDAALGLVTTAGGPNTVATGATQEVTLDMAAGNYLMVCFVSSPDGTPHIAKGMLKPFVVAPPPSQAAAPIADATVTERDFSFDAPQFTTGQKTIRVVTEGPQPHEMTLIKAGPGVTAARVQAALQNLDEEPDFPIEAAGGLGAIQPGQQGWATMNFTPGVYAMVCFVPDPATGAPHAALGMTRVFEVR
jgi:hypothetical protein